jgi:hypothetical protein
MISGAYNYFDVTIEKLSLHYKVWLELKLFHYLLENCWNKRVLAAAGLEKDKKYPLALASERRAP